MPQSGDRDLWPTTDDDEPAPPATDAATHQPPAPDQREQRWPEERPGAGGWFDRPGEPEPKRDEPHAEPSRAQQVSWPAADVANPEQVTSFFSRPLPPEPAPRQPEPEATTFFAGPLPPPAQPEATTYFGRAVPAEDSPHRFADRPAPRSAEWPPPEPPRAAPQRVGPPPRDDPEPERRGRRPLVITLVAVVAVIGIAAGVVFGVPGVSEKLGLTGEEAVVIDPPAAPVTFTPGLNGPDAGAQGPTPQGVESALAGPMSDSALGDVTGVVIDPTTGQTLYEQDATAPITPASTGKLLTAAAALLSLDHTEQLVTTVVQGAEPGTAVIVGGGDPTLSSLQVGVESVYPGAAHLTDLVDQVKATGVPVRTVYFDLDRYVGDNMAPSWEPADVAGGYIAPIVPAMLDGGRADATEDYSTRTDNPGGALVDEFAARIGATAPPSAERQAPANARVLGEVRSAPMSQLVDNMLDHSDNVLAEAIAREVAIKARKEPSFDGASEATLEVLRQHDFDVDGVVWRDASGLSAEDKVSAKLLAEILAVAAGPDGKDRRTARLRPLLGGLPVAGGSGTLADRYTEEGATEGKGWVRAKTGSLTGVNSLAGIVLDKDNRPLVFAFLTSGTTSNSARPALDKVSAALRGCGCQ